MQGYRTKVQGTEELTLKDLRIQSGRARFHAAFCQDVLAHVNRHLDIGSSSGKLLQAIAEASGGAGVGVEPGDVYREACIEAGYEVYPSLPAMEAASDKPFDLITMSHVLEHIPDPYEYLLHLRETCLSPGGYLMIEVPNLYGHMSYELTHLHAFSPGVLRLLLEGTGFRVMRVRTHGIPRSPILRLYLTILAKADGDVKPREALRRASFLTGPRRKLGMKIHQVLTQKLPTQTWKALPLLDEELDQEQVRHDER